MKYFSADDYYLYATAQANPYGVDLPFTIKFIHIHLPLYQFFRTVISHVVIILRQHLYYGGIGAQLCKDSGLFKFWRWER